ncbi:hypothetical protein CALVIDRAFT_168946 [Calocera viscosa TUFC12733]|uniref:Uncharacterized protein n=1 Tax=Calocera viscosa (strain TUFC12733) TaxID=1330018 RepID=A0A167L6U8_CALVF|nr:hypothetical protein CALVIDRAFT_168946 [Calocera viscosa TUFC12733]
MTAAGELPSAREARMFLSSMIRPLGVLYRLPPVGSMRKAQPTRGPKQHPVVGRCRRCPKRIDCGPCWASGCAGIVCDALLADQMRAGRCRRYPKHPPMLAEPRWRSEVGHAWVVYAVTCLLTRGLPAVGIMPAATGEFGSASRLGFAKVDEDRFSLLGCINVGPRSAAAHDKHLTSN